MKSKHERLLKSWMGWMLGWVALLSGILPANGLAPHEIVLVVNTASLESCTVANHYIEARSIPALNVVHLDLPEEMQQSIQPEPFQEHILRPLEAAINKRGLRGQACMVVFSAGFPHKVRTSPGTSLHGMITANTGRSEMPEGDVIKRGMWRSSFYAGPDGPDQPEGETLSMIRFSGLLTTNMPFAAVSLGYTGPRGNSVEEILACIERGVASDFTRPADPVVVITNASVRSTCRDWQFPKAMSVLKERGLETGIVVDFETQRYGGVMLGAANIDVKRCTFPPGAIADHLTSFGAGFGVPAQTKISEWIRQGATMSCGTVVEPFAIWTKFPHARVFEHATTGVSLGEAMWLSVRCPMQTFFTGEPLARPWAHRIEFEATAEVAADENILKIRTRNVPDDVDWVLLVDGRLATGRVDSNRINIPLPRIWPGAHIATVFAFRDGRVRQFGQKNISFDIPHPKAWATLEQMDNADDEPGMKRFRLATTEGREVKLMQGFRELGTGPDVTIGPKQVGSGPVTVQAEAIFGDQRIRSRPIRVHLP